MEESGVNTTARERSRAEVHGAAADTVNAARAARDYLRGQYQLRGPAHAVHGDNRLADTEKLLLRSRHNPWGDEASAGKGELEFSPRHLKSIQRAEEKQARREVFSELSRSEQGLLIYSHARKISQNLSGHVRGLRDQISKQATSLGSQLREMAGFGPSRNAWRANHERQRRRMEQDRRSWQQSARRRARMENFKRRVAMRTAQRVNERRLEAERLARRVIERDPAALREIEPLRERMELRLGKRRTTQQGQERQEQGHSRDGAARSDRSSRHSHTGERGNLRPNLSPLSNKRGLPLNTETPDYSINRGGLER